MVQPPPIPRACPNCGSTERYTTKVSSGGGYAPNYLPQLNTRWWNQSNFHVVVCAKCGLTQYFVSEENRAKLPTSSAWTRL
jgi:predicted nucleic-acid-binding Zn-ribbon protein